MKRHPAAACIMCLAVLYSGCAVHQVCDDQQKLRCCLLSLYTDQIMDNLIRASNGLPIVQMDYTDLSGTVTVMANASVSGSAQTVETNALTLPSASSQLSKGGPTTTRMLTLGARMLQLTEQVTSGVMYGGMASDNNQVVIHANPVLNNNEVYDAYLAFLAKPGSLIASPEPPPEGAAHILKCCGKTYYWVPVKYKVDFLQLSLVTTVQRGRPLSVPTYFEATITDVDIGKPLMGAAGVSFRLKLHLKKSIPNDDGTLTVAVKGEQRAFNGLQPSEAVPFGQDTDVLQLLYSSSKTGIAPADLAAALKAAPVKIELNHFHPPIPSTEELLRSMRNELEQIHLGQLR